MNLEQNKSEAMRVTLKGSIINLLLGVSKIVVGVFFFSQALIMDGIHSLSDLFTDAFVLIIAKYSYENPDEEHPYGHGRFETLGTIIIGIILISVAVFLAYDNYQLFILDQVREIPKWPTLIVAAVSIFANEWIYRFTLKAGNKIKSQLLIANAWHSRSDAFSSILVFAGLIFSINGVKQVDIIMAIFLSFFIGKVGWDFIWKSIKELVDTSLDEEVREEIKSIIKGISGVKGLHNLRSRKVGDKAILDVNIEVSPNISVSEGHEISTWVSSKIIESFDYIYDVTVHTDIEDDREDGQDFITYERNLLPLRDDILKRVESALDLSMYKKISDIKIHYVSGEVNLDLYFELEVKFSKEDYLQKLRAVDLFNGIRFFQSL